MFRDLQAHIEMLDPESHERLNARIAEHDFPDLIGFEDPNGVKLLCAFSANQEVNQVQVEYYGDEIYARPYLCQKGYVVHSNPPIFYVGARNIGGFGDKPGLHWKEDLDSYGLPRAIILKVASHFGAHAPVDW